MGKKKGVRYKVFEESIYRRDRENRLQQAFELIVPDPVKKSNQEKNRRNKTILENSRPKSKKAQ